MRCLRFPLTSYLRKSFGAISPFISKLVFCRMPKFSPLTPPTICPSNRSMRAILPPHGLTPPKCANFAERAPNMLKTTTDAISPGCSPTFHGSLTTWLAPHGFHPSLSSQNARIAALLKRRKNCDNKWMNCLTIASTPAPIRVPQTHPCLCSASKRIIHS